MLFIITLVLMLIIGVVLAKMFNDALLPPILCILGGFVLTVALVMLLIVQVTKVSEYDKAVMERNSLIYRLNHKSESIIGNELLYSDIVEFNKSLYDVKKWSQNVWFNWFWNEKIAELDYIDYEDVQNVEK